MPTKSVFESVKNDIKNLRGYDATVTSPILKLMEVKDISRRIDNSVGKELTRREAAELRIANRSTYNMLYQIINN